MDVDIDEKAVNSKVAGPSSGIMLAEGEESSPKLSKNAMKKAAKLASLLIHVCCMERAQSTLGPQRCS